MPSAAAICLIATKLRLSLVGAEAVRRRASRAAAAGVCAGRAQPRSRSARESVASREHALATVRILSLYPQYSECRSLGFGRARARGGSKVCDRKSADAYRAWRARNSLYTRMVPGAGRVSEDILAEVLGAAASYGMQTLHANLRHLHSPLSAGIMDRAQPGRVGARARHDPECSASVSEHAVAIQKRTRRVPA
jgi:hypothetical protein